MKSEEITHLKECFKDKYEAAYQQFKKDILFPKISISQQKEMIDHSIKKAEQAYSFVEEKFGRKPFKICKDLNIKIFLDGSKNKIGNLIFLSRYEKNPPAIIVYEKSLKFLNKLPEFFKYNILDITISHEIFHHLEENYFGKTYSNYRIKLWNIWKFSFNTYPAILSEIAANHFSQLINSLPFSPYIFHLILEKIYNKDNNEFHSPM